MINITIPEDCGNAPKKDVLVAFITALVCGDSAAIQARGGDEARFHQIGAETLYGKALKKWGLDFRKWAVCSLHITTILTHGRHGAIEGTSHQADGNRFGFCAVCHFAGRLRAVQ